MRSDVEFVIRKAEIEDVPAIQKLNKQLFDKEYHEYDPTLNVDWPFEEGKGFFKKTVQNEDYCSFVAIFKDQIIGYLAGNIKDAESYRNFDRLATLGNMFILDKYRNEGIGTELVKHFKEWCNSKEVKQIRVGTFISNTEAIKFYKRCGFKEHELILEI